MKIRFLALFIFLIPEFLFSQCDDFAEKVFNIIKSAQYQDFSQYLIPVEKQIKIMHYPMDSSTIKTLNSFQDTLKLSFEENSENIRNALNSKGLDINKAKYLSCERNKENLSVLKIFFHIDEILDSIFIKTTTLDQTYILQVYDYDHVELAFGESAPILVMGKKYNAYHPAEKEKEIGKTLLIKYLENKAVSYNWIKCDAKLIDRQGNAYLIFKVLLKDEQESVSFMLDWKKKVWTSIEL